MFNSNLVPAIFLSLLGKAEIQNLILNQNLVDFLLFSSCNKNILASVRFIPLKIWKQIWKEHIEAQLGIRKQLRAAFGSWAGGNQIC